MTSRRLPLRWPACVGVLALVSAAILAAAPAGAATLVQAVPALDQHVAVPAYIPPTTTAGAADWARLASSTPALGFVVANVANGPGTAVDPSWQRVIDATHAHGAKVLGYVDSGYFGFSADHRRTGSGSTDAQAWLAQAEQDVNRWYALYGSSVDGIFFDDGENQCGPTAGSNAWAELYRQLDDYVHSYHRGALTVVNPGVAVPQCYEDTADVIVTYEGSAADYLTRPIGRETQQWQRDGDPSKFWSIVYDAPDAATQAEVIDRSKQDNAGYVYVTDDGAAGPDGGVGNPYDTLPAQEYWAAEQSAATVANPGPAPATPQRPYTTDIRSLAVDLGWTSAPWNRVAGYDVYVGATKVGSVANYTPGDTRFTVVGLSPNTTYAITVRARDLAGTQSAPSAELTVRTQRSWGAPPTAPTGPIAAGTTANTTQLSWGASTDDDAHVATYEVYQDGLRELTLPASARGATVEYLRPGTDYSFTVLARDNTGTPSPMSSAVRVSTPNPAPLESPSVSFSVATAPATASFSVQYNVTYQFHHVFIDDGANHATGYAFGGITADYLFENGGFFRHDATQPGAYAWIPVTAPADSPFLLSSTEGAFAWQAAISSFTPGTTALSVVFDGSGGSDEVTLAPVVAALPSG